MSQRQIKEKWIVRSRRTWSAFIPLAVAAAGVAQSMGYPVPGGEVLEKQLTALGSGLPLVVETVALGVAGVSGLWSLLRPDNPRSGNPARLRVLPALLRRFQHTP